MGKILAKEIAPFHNFSSTPVRNENSSCHGGSRSKGRIKESTLDAPLVSIITAVFNGENTIKKCIESVRNQHYSNIEYIIIDGASTDNTLAILKEYEHCIDLWISEPDEGIYDAFNKGLGLVKGEWVCFLGCDDALENDALTNYVQYLEREKNSRELDYICGKAQFVDANGKEIRTVGAQWEWKTFKRFMCTSHTGALHNVGYFKTYGQFDVSFKIAGDYELLLRAKDKLKAGYVDRSVTMELMTGVSNASVKVFSEVYRAKVKNKCRNKLMAAFDFLISISKFGYRKIRHLNG